MTDNDSTILPHDVPPLKRGDECKALNGGPILTVTAEDGDFLLCTWPYGKKRIARAEVRRFDKAADWKAK